MMYEEFCQSLEQLGYPYTYREYGPGEVPQTPYLVWYISGRENFAADGKVYFSSDNVCLELYTGKKMPEVEQRIEEMLNEKGIYWEKEEFYIESEKYIEQLYTFCL